MTGAGTELGLAISLARKAGLPEPVAVQPLPGGRNNRVYRVDGPAASNGLGGPGGPWLLKHYFSHPGDRRDRLGAEFAFLSLAASLGEAQVPRPLARTDQGPEAPADNRADNCADDRDGDRDEDRAALYTFAPGRALGPGEVDAGHVRQALELVLRLNSPQAVHAARLAHAPIELADAPVELADAPIELADAPIELADAPIELADAPIELADASEACFSLDAHLALIKGRVARLAGLAPADALDRQALAFVAERLTPALEQACGAARALARPEDLAPLPQEARCVSPSDFGFHNALLGEDGRLTFLDFEYAGLDDPAKLVCDFFLQPRVPAPWACFAEFRDRLASGLGQGRHAEALARRVAALFPAYRVKWCCILLGEFLAVSGARRCFSAGSEHPARPRVESDTRARQLHLAQDLLERDLQIP